MRNKSLLHVQSTYTSQNSAPEIRLFSTETPFELGFGHRGPAFDPSVNMTFAYSALHRWVIEQDQGAGTACP